MDDMKISPDGKKIFFVYSVGNGNGPSKLLCIPAILMELV
jgi:hypothetical protein